MLSVPRCLMLTHIRTGSACSESSVALQTALASVNEKKECTVRVLLDTGSHKSFVSARAVKSLELKPVRREKLANEAFGSNESEETVRDVVEFSLSSLRGGKRVEVQCKVVDEITDIANEHIEVVKKSYSHLKNVWFSDVSRHQETLSIDIVATPFWFLYFPSHILRVLIIFYTSSLSLSIHTQFPHITLASTYVIASCPLLMSIVMPKDTLSFQTQSLFSQQYILFRGKA